MTSPIILPDGPIGVVLSRLEKVAKNATGWIARCPAHGDGNPSLSVSIGDDGRVLVHCFAGCTTGDITAALNLSPRDLFPPRNDRPVTSAARKTFVKAYDYHDERGNLSFQVVRWDPKDFSQRRPSGDPTGKEPWIWSMKGHERVLYHLPEVLEAKSHGRVIFVAEGEKDADNLREHGFVATTNPGGAKKWNPSYTDTLRGTKVVLVPDNDKAGDGHRDLVATALHGAVAELRVVQLPTPHKDVSDWLKAGGSREALIELVRATPLWEPSTTAAPTTSGNEIAFPVERVGGGPPATPPPTQGEKPKKFARSDTGNGERMIARHGRELRYVKLWKSWLVWNGRCWERDETLEVDRRAKDSIRSMYDDLRNINLRADEREEILKFIIKSESDGRIRGMIARAATEDGIAIRTDQLDADPYLLTVGNGTLDLRSGNLRPHDPADLITKSSKVNFDPNAECPTWLAFLDRIMAGKEDMVRYLQTVVGYGLTGITSERCFFFCYGDGANGKTTLLEIISDLVGDYATRADFSTFIERKNEGPRNDVAGLLGARIVTASEVSDGKRLDEQVVKALTGDERLKARFLYAELFEFAPTFKIFLAANHKPIIRGTDNGIWDRVRLIPFSVRIPKEEQDKELKNKLRAELPGILAWAVEGCQLWLEQGGLGTPLDVGEASRSYRAESDVVGEFLSECCEVSPGHTGFAEPASALYNAYKHWAKENNLSELNIRRFGDYLSKIGVPADLRGTGTNRKKWRVGIRLVARPEGRHAPSGSTPPDREDDSETFF